ncbi:MAG: helix-turn-helix domain-containing protein [Salinibacter sp.]
MAIGERLRMAREAAGLSLRKVAEETRISHTAVSKYEKDRMTPDSSVLIRLARAYGVKVEYFFRPVELELAPQYRRRQRLGVKQQKMILGEVRDWLERYVAIEGYFHREPRFAWPEDVERSVASLEDVERASEGLRDAWDLGADPIENLTDTLEERGVKVGQVQGHSDFDALTFTMDGDVPVIAIKADLTGDRQRFSIAHELSHCLLNLSDELDEEGVAYRFAGAFLVPQGAARRELGESRRSLDYYELHLLKHKYGMSMAAWIYRAQDLGIISKTAAARYFKDFRKRGWLREEPGDQINPEELTRMKRLVLRALNEGKINRSRASELVGEPWEAFVQQESKEHGDFPVDVRG